LRDGLHTYKFIVDGQWITDPANKRVRPDGEGNFNSVTGIGDTVVFTLKGFTNANSVILSGNFNNWRTAELVMDKTTDGWKLDYMLPPGNYEYKFIVDGTWITDPFNAFTRGSNDAINSVRAVKPNYVFRLKKNLDAQEVFVNGSFNDWNEPGYKMFKLKDEWVFPVHLKPGKQLYKFVVDDKWIIDPDNKNWEENEYNSGNSVLWIESK
jgi:1,4-alpha-glucan branching enzyme